MARTESTPPIIRLAHPVAFGAFLRHVGAPVDRYFGRHGLPLLCEEADAFVPLARVWSFFDSAARTEDPMLGWLVGAYVGDHHLSAGLLRKLETAPSLLVALETLVRLVSSESSNLHMGICEQQDDVAFFTCHPGLRQAPGYPIAQAYQLGVVLDLIRHFLGRQWIPREVGLESPFVPPGLEKRFPGGRILARRERGYVAVPRSCLHRAAGSRVAAGNRGEDPALTREFDYVDALRGMLRSYLAEGYPSQRFAAELMDTSVRTLTRKLAARNVTYGALIDGLRFAVAKEHLQNPDMRNLDVAQSVGFRDQGDFTRMFRRIGGLTPGEFRKVARSPDLR